MSQYNIRYAAFLCAFLSSAGALAQSGQGPAIMTYGSTPNTPGDCIKIAPQGGGYLADNMATCGSSTLIMMGYTVSTLPSTAGTGMQTGAIAYVTDATTCTFMGTLVGGGSAIPVCPVFYNGTAWLAG